MERIRHIAETQNKLNLNASTESGESSPYRDKIAQPEPYDKNVSEIYPEQQRARKYLESFNEGVLKEIFAEYFRKAGSDETTLNWIPLDMVRILYDEAEDISTSSNGIYSLHNGISLYAHNLETKEQTLHTLIHEMSHALSSQTVKQSATTSNGISVARSVQQNGVESNSIVAIFDDLGVVDYNSGVVSTNTYANEGITELITDKIFQTYLQRTGTSNKEYEAFSAGEIASLNRKYPQYRRNIKLYSAVISTLSGIGADRVEDSIIRTYLRNGEIMPEEITETLASLDPELPQLLAQMINNDDLDKSSWKANLVGRIYALKSISREQAEVFAQAVSEIVYESTLADMRVKDLTS